MPKVRVDLGLFTNRFANSCANRAWNTIMGLSGLDFSFSAY